VVTRQLQVERRTGKVRRPKANVLPLCYANSQQKASVYYADDWSAFPQIWYSLFHSTLSARLRLQPPTGEGFVEA